MPESALESVRGRQRRKVGLVQTIPLGTKSEGKSPSLWSHGGGVGLRSFFHRYIYIDR